MFKYPPLLKIPKTLTRVFYNLLSRCDDRFEITLCSANLLELFKFSLHNFIMTIRRIQQD